MIKLGQVVQDKISGFEGVATARAEYLNGCIRFQVSPQTVDEKGKVQEAMRFDVVQLVEYKPPKTKKKAPGGPMAAPKTAADPR